jgi:predicted GTPase
MYSEVVNRIPTETKVLSPSSIFTVFTFAKRKQRKRVQQFYEAREQSTKKTCLQVSPVYT